MSHDNWSTPPDLFKLLDNEFHFVLDAAASSDNHLLPLYFSEKEADALTTPWSLGPIYCNPPYSMLPAFVYRAWEQHIIYKQTIVLLLPAYTDTRWFYDYCRNAAEIRFLKGRLRFWEDGKPGKDTARFSSVIVVFADKKSPNTDIFFWNWKSLAV